MTRARELARLGNTNVITADSNFNVGIGSLTPDAKLDVVGVVSATEFYGDGSNLSGITAGATLSAGSGSQRVVVTSLTSGTMTTAATDAELSYNSDTNTLHNDGDVKVGDTDIQGTQNAEGLLLAEGGYIRARNGSDGNLWIGYNQLSNNATSIISSDGDATFNGNVSIGGTLTYEDVTNIDSVGIITAQSGIRVGAGESISPVSGTITYYGDGSQLTGIAAGISTEAASGGQVTLDLSNQDHKVTVSGITTITCSGGTEGDSHTVRIVNSGSANIGFSTYFLWPSGSSPAIPTASGTISLISFTVHRVGTAGTQLLAGASLDFS